MARAEAAGEKCGLAGHVAVLTSRVWLDGKACRPMGRTAAAPIPQLQAYPHQQVRKKHEAVTTNDELPQG